MEIYHKNSRGTIQTVKWSKHSNMAIIALFRLNGFFRIYVNYNLLLWQHSRLDEGRHAKCTWSSAHETKMQLYKFQWTGEFYNVLWLNQTLHVFLFMKSFDNGAHTTTALC